MEEAMGKKFIFFNVYIYTLAALGLKQQHARPLVAVGGI